MADPPTITEFPEVDPIRVGEDFDLSCSADGVPTPNITIYKDDTEISSFTGRSVQLTITSATARKDHGKYTCIVNSISKTTGQQFPIDSRSIQVIVQGLCT